MRIIVVLLVNLSSFIAFCQEKQVTLQEALDLALQNNKGIKAAEFELEHQKQLKKTSFDLPKTEIALTYGQYNSFVKSDNNFSVSQIIPFAALGSQAPLNRALVVSAQLKKSVTENELVFQVKQTYYRLAFAKSMHDLLLQQDSIYRGIMKFSSQKYHSGESNLLEQATAETQVEEIKSQIYENESSQLVLQTQLMTLLGIEELPDLSRSGSFEQIRFKEIPDSGVIQANPALAYMQQQIEVAERLKKVEVAKFGPDFLFGFFSQTLIGSPTSENGVLATGADRFAGFQIGISIPLWFGSLQARVRAAEYKVQSALSNFQYHNENLSGQIRQAVLQLAQNKNRLEYYKTSALPNADLILNQAEIAFHYGEIGYIEYFLLLRNALTIKEGYLQSVNNYNQSILHLEFLLGNK